MDNSGNLFWDILSFRVLITPSVLVFLYYFGAIVIPIASWFYFAPYVRKARAAVEEHLVESKIVQSLKKSNFDGRFWFYAVVIFIFMQLAWRIMFEFFIAYFQMHNSLMALAPLN